MPTATPLTRKERRDQARRERIEREHADAAGKLRRRRLASLGGVIAAAAVVVAVLIAVSSSGGGGASSTASTAKVAGASQAQTLLTGIPQRGITLGASNAPVHVVEFADLQCPFCRDASAGVLPNVIRDYVRPGRARIDFRALTFIGPDSERAGRVAEAAGAQNKLWNVVDLLYANQGGENSGWATDALLRGVTGAVPGLDVSRVFAARNGAQATDQLSAAATLANKSGVSQTPTFLVGRGTSLRAVDAAGLPAAIKAALGG